MLSCCRRRRRCSKPNVVRHPPPLHSTPAADMSRRREGVRCCQRRDAAHAVSLARGTQPSAATGRRRRASSSGPPSRAAHHGCGLSRDVTTKSVRSLPQLEQRNRRSDQRHVAATGVESFCRTAQPDADSRPCTRPAGDVARSQRGPLSEGLPCLFDLLLQSVANGFADL